MSFVADVRMYLFVFGVLTVVGGVVGFARAKSRASLVAGGVSGVLLLTAGFLVGSDNARVGLILGAILSVALAGRFLPGFARSRKIMPAGLMAILSIGGAVLTILALLRS